MTISIDQVLREDRSFPPSSEFSSQANLQSEEDYKRLWNFAKDEPETFWAEQASKYLKWEKTWDQVLVEKENCHFEWFVGGTLNACTNCVDRHLKDRGDKTAILWEGEPGETRALTYRDLHKEICKFANVLTKLGVSERDVVTIYMPMVPELLIAMLACARIGAMHNVVFAGFSAQALQERINNSRTKVVVTADGGFRKGKSLPLKATVDESLKQADTVEKVVVLKRTNAEISMTAGRDFWWMDLMEKASEHHKAKAFDAEHPLFLLYTSGSTGKPKGILHTTGGYLLGATFSMQMIFDLKEEDIFWCTADAGWVTGHSYVTYGPLSAGATVVIYEGSPNFPDFGRFWKIVEKHKVSILYTAPTAIRAFMREGKKWPESYDLSSLRLLGTVGEPINPEAWIWYREVIGGKRCPIVDTWWQTETGGILIAPLPGISATHPGSASVPFFGVVAEVVDEKGKALPPNKGGFLVIRKPWPNMLRGIYGDGKRYREQYWSQIPGSYFTGDSARRDAEGNFWIMGRVDDVINVSGHRLSTMEIESSLVSHTAVAEAAVVGKPDPIKGEALSCFVILKDGQKKSEGLVEELKQHVALQIGALARPSELCLVDSLPKTRSGKIMRRVLRALASGEKISGDLSTLED
ncbi:MAG: acetate--CoA ligase [Deltaproteobacteria bacterium]|nr:acetate--CoA ligase [Deltaproteobacteria bacterium]